MKLEIEAKIKVDNLDLIVHRLVQAGATPVSTVWEEDIYFDTASSTLLNNDCGLRLRKRITKGKGEQFILAFKGPRQDSAFKSRSEIETTLSSHQAMVLILEQLGCHRSLRVEKKRRIWQLDTCEICLDDVQELGQFVEIEGPSETAVAAVLEKLGLDPKAHISEGYARLIAKALSDGK